MKVMECGNCGARFLEDEMGTCREVVDGESVVLDTCPNCNSGWDLSECDADPDRCLRCEYEGDCDAWERMQEDMEETMDKEVAV